MLVEEKGINTYKRIADSQCAAAKKYWEKNKEYWGKVRSTWENYLAIHSTLEMKTLVDGKPLHDFLFALAKDYADGKIKPDEIDAKIKSSIESFFGHDQKEVAASSNNIDISVLHEKVMRRIFGIYLIVLKITFCSCKTIVRAVTFSYAFPTFAPLKIRL